MSILGGLHRCLKGGYSLGGRGKFWEGRLAYRCLKRRYILRRRVDSGRTSYRCLTLKGGIF